MNLLCAIILVVNAGVNCTQRSKGIERRDLGKKKVSAPGTILRRAEITVDQEPNHRFRTPNMGTHTRARKFSLDYYSNTLLLDKNGNSNIFKRLASLSEDDNEPGNNSDHPDVASEQAWKNTFLNQIQNLLKDVHMSDALSEKVYDEIMDKTMNNDNVPSKNRRNSCFTLTSAVNTKRRSSVVPKNAPVSSENRRRRMSHAGMTSLILPTSGRRCSVANLPSSGRRLSCANNNFQAQFLRQRRKSSAKPIALNVVKVSSVQKQLHKIYKKRRRRDRASVNIEDVRDALRGPDDKENSDSEPEVVKSDPEVDYDNKENAIENADNNNVDVWEDVPDGEPGCSSVLSTDKNSSYTNINNSSNNIDCNSVGVVSEPRRRDSTQMRAWELSRKLRQRRKGRRQASADF